MYQFQIRVLAKKDIQHIVDYYDAQVPYVTNKFLNKLYAELELIKQAPKQFQIKYKKYTCSVYKRLSVWHTL